MDLQQLIDDYLEGRMSPEDRRLFEDLIEENPRYQAELAQQEKGKAALRLAGQSHRGKTANLKSWLFSIGVGAIIVLAAALLWLTLGLSPGEKIFKKHYETLPNQITASSYGQSNADLKAQAFQAYEAKDFEKAAQLFDRIPSRPDSEYVFLYHGICQLELDRPEKAIPLLNLVKSNSTTASKEVASWFAALAYFKLDMLEKGKQALQVTAAKPNPYQTQARTLLETLK